MIWTNFPTRAGFLIALCSFALAACDKKTEVTSEATKSQVVAKIGKDVVTVQELDNEFRLENVPVERRKDPETIKRVLGGIITRKYLVQKALDAKLDREPTVLLDILRSKDLVLANALASRDVTNKSAAISQSDIDNYIAKNPQKFANRKLMSVEQIAVALGATSQAVIEATKEMNTLDEVDQKLTGMGVPHGRSTGTISTGDLPNELLTTMTSKPDQIFFVRSGTNGIFFKITGQEARPLDGSAAIDAARQYLRQDIIRSEIGMTSVAANLEAKYEGEFSVIMGRETSPMNPK